MVLILFSQVEKSPAAGVCSLDIKANSVNTIRASNEKRVSQLEGIEKYPVRQGRMGPLRQIFVISCPLVLYFVK